MRSHEVSNCSIPNKNRRVIHEFLRSINKSESRTFYAAYQEAGSKTSFVHVMAFIDARDERNHARAPYTRKFVSILYPQCTKKPVFTELKLVQKTK